MSGWCWCWCCYCLLKGRSFSFPFDSCAAVTIVDDSGSNNRPNSATGGYTVCVDHYYNDSYSTASPYRYIKQNAQRRAGWPGKLKAPTREKTRVFYPVRANASLPPWPSAFFPCFLTGPSAFALWWLRRRRRPLPRRRRRQPPRSIFSGRNTTRRFFDAKLRYAALPTWRNP